VTQQDREPPGDYGYDMAHEEPARERAVHPPATGEPHREPEAAAGRRGPSDQGGDYGYDEAHSL
jgi:hypothetical protein